MSMAFIFALPVFFSFMLLFGIIFSQEWALKDWVFRMWLATWVVMLAIVCFEPILGYDVPVEERIVDLCEETSGEGRIQFVFVDDKQENVTKASLMILPYPGKVVRRKTERRFLGFVFGSNVTYEPAGPQP